jgi:two-component system OmpR family response regulator
MEILLIEDDIQTQHHVAACLDAQGHAVTRAGAGDRGMQYALENDYAAIIVDRMLPVMDGISVVKALRNHGKQTPILILTTMDGIDDGWRGWKRARTTISSNPSRCPNSWPGSTPSPAAPRAS